jgi:hypothetical protein
MQDKMQKENRPTRQVGRLVGLSNALLLEINACATTAADLARPDTSG